MKNFFALFKILVKNDLRKDKNKKGFKFDSALLAEIIIGAIMVIAMIALSLTVGVYLNGLGLGAEYLGFLFLIAQFIVLIFGTVLLLSVMYFSKDVSFLLPLPVKTSAIFWAKFAYVYVRELFFAGLIVITGGITFLIAVNAAISSYFILILVALLVPCLPLMLSSILSLPIIFFSGYFKSKGPVLAVILTVIFSAVMFVYMYFINSMQFLTDNSGGFSLPLETQKGLINFFNIFIPVGSLAKLILLKDILTNLGLFAASYAVLIILILLMSKFTFKRAIQKQLEESKGKASSELKYSKNTVIKSIIKKDFKEIMRNPGLAFNCLVSVVLGPLFIVVFGLTAKAGIYGGETAGIISNLAIGFMFLTLFPSSVNMAGLSSVTREGKNFYHLKTLPVKYEDQLSAKIILAKIFAFTAVITSAVAFLIFSKTDIFISLGIIIFALLFADGYVHYIVYLDLKHPKLNHESVTAALKNSKSSILSMLIALGLLLPLLIALILFIMLLYESIHIMLLWTAIFIPAFTYAIILNLVFRKKIRNNGVGILESIEP